MNAAPHTPFERLKAAAIDDWNSYVDHAFVRQMEAATLPQPVFQAYLVQDYLFLIQYARAYALAITKSPGLEDMEISRIGLNSILGEMGMHVRLCERWDISAAELEATPEHQATIAYTRYVLDRGHTADLLELLVALSPCAVGYAEIGKRLEPALAGNASHPYAEWIREYASEGFQQVAQISIDQINRLAGQFMTEARFTELAAVFAKASRLEADFWQMGFDLAAAASRRP